MKEKFYRFCTGPSRWLLYLIPVVAAALGLILWGSRPEPEVRTVAEPTGEQTVTFQMENNRAYTPEDGVVVIPPAVEETKEAEAAPTAVTTLSDPSQVWEQGTPLSTGSYTLSEEIAAADGSIGTLSIPRLNLSAPVYEPEAGGEMESMTKGIAHFSATSAWAGTIGLCSHNEAPAGAVAYFRDLHRLEKGDTVFYTTSLGDRQYLVTQVGEIAEDDWTPLSPGAEGENKIVLITCITGKPDRRLMVQATEQ